MTSETCIAPPPDVAGMERAATILNGCLRSRAKAEAALPEARRAVDAAKTALANGLSAAAGGAVVDLKALQSALRETEGALELAQQMDAATTTALAAAWQAVRQAQHDGNLPPYRHAIGLRIAAAAKADVARAMLAEAEQDTRAATRLIEQAHAAGVQRPFDGGRLHQPVRTEAAERQLWGALA